MPPILYKNRLSADHDTGDNHPEHVARVETLQALFGEAPFHKWAQKMAIPATEEQILRVHDEQYYYSLQNFTPNQELIAIDGDTMLSKGSFDSALHAAGSVVTAVDDIIKGQTQRAFCAIRPPGHHAEPGMAMGFCLFNNVMVGALQAIKQHGCTKVAVIDFDVHHGNGSETMGYKHNGENEDSKIFYASSHAYPLFPMTGDPRDNGPHLMNVRLEQDFAPEDFHLAYKQHILPALDEFAPDFLMISAGFDAHVLDDISQARLETEDFRCITKELVKMANKHCDGRICSVLEGGYDLNTLKDSTRAHLEELAEE
ncbi:MAG: histone deacetylase family protein [Pseudomonadota bacterium]